MAVILWLFLFIKWTACQQQWLTLFSSGISWNLTSDSCSPGSDRSWEAVMPCAQTEETTCSADWKSWFLRGFPVWDYSPELNNWTAQKTQCKGWCGGGGWQAGRALTPEEKYPGNAISTGLRDFMATLCWFYLSCTSQFSLHYGALVSLFLYGDKHFTTIQPLFYTETCIRDRVWCLLYAM